MKQVSDEVIQVAMLRRCTPESDRKKKAIERRRASGPSIGVLMATSGVGIPWVTVISPRNADLSNEEVEIMSDHLPSWPPQPLFQCLGKLR